MASSSSERTTRDRRPHPGLPAPSTNDRERQINRISSTDSITGEKRIAACSVISKSGRIRKNNKKKPSHTDPPQEEEPEPRDKEEKKILPAPVATKKPLDIKKRTAYSSIPAFHISSSDSEEEGEKEQEPVCYNSRPSPEQQQSEEKENCYSPKSPPYSSSSSSGEEENVEGRGTNNGNASECVHSSVSSINVGISKYVERSPGKRIVEEKKKEIEKGTTRTSEQGTLDIEEGEILSDAEKLKQKKHPGSGSVPVLSSSSEEEEESDPDEVVVVTDDHQKTQPQQQQQQTPPAKTNNQSSSSSKEEEESEEEEEEGNNKRSVEPNSERDTFLSGINVVIPEEGYEVPQQEKQFQQKIRNSPVISVKESDVKRNVPIVRSFAKKPYEEEQKKQQEPLEDEKKKNSSSLRSRRLLSTLFER